MAVYDDVNDGPIATYKWNNPISNSSTGSYTYAGTTTTTTTTTQSGTTSPGLTQQLKQYMKKRLKKSGKVSKVKFGVLPDPEPDTNYVNGIDINDMIKQAREMVD